MDSKITSTRKTRSGFTLPEMMVVVGISALLFLSVCAFSMFCGRSFAALYNYVDLDDMNRVAIDTLTRDVRQCSRVNYYSTDGYVLGLLDADGVTIGYTYSPTARTLTRVKGAERRIVLKECDKLRFSLGQRNTDVGGYDVFPVTSDISIAKVINVSWVCSRSLFGRKENTESVQTARIVIRKQGTST